MPSPETSYTPDSLASKLSVAADALPQFTTLSLSDKDITEINASPDKSAAVKALIEKQSGQKRAALATAVAASAVRAPAPSVVAPAANAPAAPSTSAVVDTPASAANAPATESTADNAPAAETSTQEAKSPDVESAASKPDEEKPKPQPTTLDRLATGEKTAANLTTALKTFNELNFTSIDARAVVLNGIIEYFIYSTGRNIGFREGFWNTLSWERLKAGHFCDAVEVSSSEGIKDEAMSKALNGAIKEEDFMIAWAVNRATLRIKGTNKTYADLAEEIAKKAGLVVTGQTLSGILAAPDGKGRFQTALNSADMSAEDAVILRTYLLDPTISTTTERVSIEKQKEKDAALTEILSKAPHSLTTEQIVTLLAFPIGVDEMKKDPALKRALETPAIFTVLTKRANDISATAHAKTPEGKRGELPPKPTLDEVIRDPSKILSMLPHMWGFGMAGVIYLLMWMFGIWEKDGKLSKFRTAMGALGAVGIFKAFGGLDWAADMVKNGKTMENVQEVWEWIKNIGGRITGFSVEKFKDLWAWYDLRDLSGAVTENGQSVRRNVLDMPLMGLQSSLTSGNFPALNSYKDGKELPMTDEQKATLQKNIQDAYGRWKKVAEEDGKTESEYQAEIANLSVLEVIDWTTDTQADRQKEWIKPGPVVSTIQKLPVTASTATPAAGNPWTAGGNAPAPQAAASGAPSAPALTVGGAAPAVPTTTVPPTSAPAAPSLTV